MCNKFYFGMLAYAFTITTKAIIQWLEKVIIRSEPFHTLSRHDRKHKYILCERILFQATVYKLFF